MVEKWQPIQLSQLNSLVSSEIVHLNGKFKEFWLNHRVTPEKWSLSPWSDLGGGFYVVAISNHHVIWFNDIEKGFNISKYETAGVISSYGGDQDELCHSISRILAFEENDA